MLLPSPATNPLKHFVQQMAGVVPINTSFLPSTSALRRPSPAVSADAAAALARPPIQSKIREIFMPALSSTMTEGKIVSWVKSEGDKLSKGESVVVVESDKADMDVETFYDGYLAAIMVDEGGVAPVGSAIAFLAETPDEIATAKSKATGGGAVTPARPPPPPPPQPTAPAAESTASALSPAASAQPGQRIVATPYAKKLAKELKVELAVVAGSGPMGRIVAKDVEAAVAVAAVSATARPAAAEAPASSPAVELGSVVPFTTMQNAVSRNMVESLAVPTFRVGYTITTDALDQVYQKV